MTEWHCPSCSNASLDVYTVWIPLQKLDPSNDSVLAVLEESHLFSGFDDPISAQLSLPSDFLGLHPSMGPKQMRERWQIPVSIDLGDAIIFNAKSIHGATAIITLITLSLCNPSSRC